MYRYQLNTVPCFHVLLSIANIRCMLGSWGFERLNSWHLCMVAPPFKCSSIASLPSNVRHILFSLRIWNQPWRTHGLCTCMLHINENPRECQLNKLNQVTLFANYSCNNFHDLLLIRKYVQQTECFVPKFGIFLFFIWELYVNIPLMETQAGVPAILIF